MAHCARSFLLIHGIFGAAYPQSVFEIITQSATLIIIVITALVSLVAFNDQRIFRVMIFEPFVIKVRGEWYRFISHAFIHSNWPHLLVNMFVLFMFGMSVERNYMVLTASTSVLPYITLYVGGILFSSLPAYKKYLLDPNYRAVGASGAVSAVLFAQILMFPTTSIYFLFIPFPIPAFVFGILYLVYSYFMDKRGGDNVAHDAHFYGAVFGILFTAFLEPALIFDIGSHQRSFID